MSALKTITALADAYDAGFAAGEREPKLLLAEVRRQLEKLIESAVRRGEYEALVHARQILRRLK